MQSEFTALQDATRLNELEVRVWTQAKMFKLIKYINEIVNVQIE